MVFLPFFEDFDDLEEKDVEECVEPEFRRALFVGYRLVGLLLDLLDGEDDDADEELDEAEKIDRIFERLREESTPICFSLESVSLLAARKLVILCFSSFLAYFSRPYLTSFRSTSDISSSVEESDSEEEENKEKDYVLTWGYHQAWHGPLTKEDLNAVSSTVPILIFGTSKFHSND